MDCQSFNKCASYFHVVFPSIVLDIYAVSQYTRLYRITEAFEPFGHGYSSSCQSFFLNQVATLSRTKTLFEFCHDHGELPHLVQSSIPLAAVEKCVLFT